MCYFIITATHTNYFYIHEKVELLGSGTILNCRQLGDLCMTIGHHWTDFAEKQNKWMLYQFMRALESWMSDASIKIVLKVKIYFDAYISTVIFASILTLKYSPLMCYSCKIGYPQFCKNCRNGHRCSSVFLSKWSSDIHGSVLESMPFQEKYWNYSWNWKPITHAFYLDPYIRLRIEVQYSRKS